MNFHGMTKETVMGHTESRQECTKMQQKLKRPKETCRHLLDDTRDCLFSHSKTRHLMPSA